jgi:hypothetical protein
MQVCGITEDEWYMHTLWRICNDYAVTLAERSGLRNQTSNMHSFPFRETCTSVMHNPTLSSRFTIYNKHGV